MKFLLFVSLSIALCSCSELNKSEQIKRLDAMLVTIESSEEFLYESEIENASELLSVSSELVDGIKGFEDDTIQLDVAYKFDEFKTMFDDVAPTIAHYDELLEAVRLEKAVLLKLEKDIRRADGKRHKYDEYIAFEEKKVTKLKSAISLYVERKNNITTTYNELHNEISQLLVERFSSSEVQ